MVSSESGRLLATVRAFHTWQRRDARHGAAVEIQRLCLAVLGRRQKEAPSQDVAGLKAQIDLRQIPQAGDHQAGSDQQHERQGHFHRHHRLAEDPASPASRGSACRILESVLNVGTRDGQRGRQAEKDARRHRYAQRKQNHIRVQLGGSGGGKRAGRKECGHSLDQRARQSQTRQSAGQSQQHTLREKLPQQAHSRGPHCDSDRDLPGAGGRADQEQARDVGARHHQNQSHRARQQ